MTNALIDSLSLPIKILLVEENPLQGIAFNIKQYDYKVADSLAGAKNILDSQSFDLVILDYQSEDSKIFQLLDLIKAKNCPSIIITESGNEETIAQLMNEGAYGYLIKDLNCNYLKILPALVTKVLAHKKAEEEVRLLTQSPEVNQLLSQSEAEKSALLNAMPDLIMRIDKDGTYLEFNPTNNFKILNKSGKFKGTKIHESLSPELTKQRMEAIEAALRTRSIQFYEQELIIDNETQIEEVRVVPYTENEVLLLVRDISARKLAERSLQASEKKFSTIFRVSPDSIVITSITDNYKLTDINDRFTELIGYSYTEAIGKNSADLNLWVDPEAKNQFWSTLQQQRSIDNFEAQIRHKSGQVLTLLMSAEVFYLNEQEYSLTISKDISDLKAARESLRQLNQELEKRVKERTADLMESQRKYQKSEERNLDILNALPDLLLRLKRDGTCLDCILPSSPGAGSFIPIKHHLSEILSPQILAQQLEIFETALRTNQIQIYEHQLTKRGKIVQEEVRVSPCGGDEVLVVIRDISDRKQAQEAVLESKQFLQTILDTFPLVVFWKDRNSVFLGCNLNCAKACGLTSPAEVVGKTDYDLPWSKEESDAYRADDRKVIESGQAKLGIIETQRQIDGSVIWLETNKIPLSNIRGEIVGILGTYQDITERIQAETLLRESNQQLALTNEELLRVTRHKDEFLANMSHELRTPLNAILGMSEGLQEQVFGTINKQQEQALKTIQRTSNHLLELINEILDLAKIGAGQIELNYTRTAISQLASSTLSFIKQQALQKNLQLEVSIQANLPEMLVDERRIKQVLINLLNNAVKFTPTGGKITLAVSRFVHQEEGSSALRDFIRFAVIDTGIGIKAENLNKLFQPFVQIDTALNRQYTGTGLGLSLVKRIVEIHGGSVGVESQEGVGSCFTIDLPLNHPQLSNQAIAPSNLTQYETSETASHQLLLVEDNEATINTISSYLKAKGYRIILAKNGQEAVEMATRQIPDLILMDIQMSGMDGLEATRVIRSYSKLVSIPIIALTALAMPGDRERCLEAGANEYITKPVKLSQLTITIGQFLTAQDKQE